MEPLTFAQIQSARLQHCQTAEPSNSLPEPQQTAHLHQDQRNIVNDNGVLYQKCGGGRRIIRKKIGGN